MFPFSITTHATGECERLESMSTSETTCIPSQPVNHAVVLERPLTTDQEIWSWRDLVANGQLPLARANCTVYLVRISGYVVQAFDLKNVWPASVEIRALETEISEEEEMQNRVRHSVGPRLTLTESIVLIVEDMRLYELGEISLLSP